MTILANGSVGIGDAIPDGQLEVCQTGTGDILNLYDSTINVFTVEDGGDRCIGTSDPIARLQVFGDGVGTVLRVTNGGGSGGTAITAGDVIGTGRAASFYGVISSDLITVHNDGLGKAAKFTATSIFLAAMSVSGRPVPAPSSKSPATSRRMPMPAWAGTLAILQPMRPSGRKGLTMRYWLMRITFT